MTSFAHPTRPHLSPRDGSASGSDLAPLNHNLCDLFFADLALTVEANKCAHLAALETTEWLPVSQAALRRASHEVSETARTHYNRLNDAVQRQQLPLPLRHDPTIDCLLESVSPESQENIFEPWAVVGTRTISVLRRVSIQLALQAEEVAEYAYLLGSDALHTCLRDAAAAWARCADLLKGMKARFCAEAYIADLGNHPSAHQFA